MSRIDAMSTRRKFILFALMAVGQFMALLDTQIVAASIFRHPGRSRRRAGRKLLGADRLSYRRDCDDPPLRLAIEGIFDALALHGLGSCFYPRQHRVRLRVEYPVDDYGESNPGICRRRHDPDRFRHRLRAF